MMTPSAPCSEAHRDETGPSSQHFVGASPRSARRSWAEASLEPQCGSASDSAGTRAHKNKRGFILKYFFPTLKMARFDLNDQRQIKMHVVLVKKVEKQPRGLLKTNCPLEFFSLETRKKMSWFRHREDVVQVPDIPEPSESVVPVEMDTASFGLCFPVEVACLQLCMMLLIFFFFFFFFVFFFFVFIITSRFPNSTPPTPHPPPEFPERLPRGLC
jgi:hypothetical protein